MEKERMNLRDLFSQIAFNYADDNKNELIVILDESYREEVIEASKYSTVGTQLIDKDICISYSSLNGDICHIMYKKDLEQPIIFKRVDNGRKN